MSREKDSPHGDRAPGTDGLRRRWTGEYAERNPEVTINNTNTSRIKSALVERCSAEGYRMTQDTQFNLEFVKQMDIGTSALYTVAMGSSYSSHPNLRLSFTITPSGGATRVFGHIGVEMQGVFGQNQGTSLDQGKAGKQVQALLEQLKADMESRVETRRESTSPSETMPPTTASPAEQPTSAPSATAQPQESPP